MTHDTGSLTSSDGTTLFTRHWRPDGEARALVVLVHGLHEHSGRYAYLASALMRRGLAVHALDLRGHGQSEGRRGQVDHVDEFVDDVHALLREAREEAGDRPLFLLGHSMGGLVAALYVVERGTDGLAGVVLSSPALADDAPAFLKKLAPVLARWLPNLPAQPLDLSGLSRDPVVERQYREDPLTLKQGIRARLAAELLKGMDRVRRRPEAFDAPLYLFHGTDDAIVPDSGTAWLAEHAASDDVTLRLWDGLYHETMNEPERDEVIAALADWLDAHVGAPA